MTASLDRRVLALEGAIAVTVFASVLSLKKFVVGMISMQDLWNGSDYVRLLLLGFFFAAAAVAASEAVRRLDRSPDGIASTFVFLARAMLAIQILALLYCNSGPFRAVIYSGARLLTTYGMARDLPAPPPSASM